MNLFMMSVLHHHHPSTHVLLQYVVHFQSKKEMLLIKNTKDKEQNI